MTEETIKEYFDSFLSHTSCAKDKELSWFDDNFILLKHIEHTAHVSRFFPPQTGVHGTYYFLVNVGVCTASVVKYGDLYQRLEGVHVFPFRLVAEHRRKIQKLTGSELPEKLPSWNLFNDDSPDWGQVRVRLYELELKRVIDSDQKKTEIKTTN